MIVVKFSHLKTVASSRELQQDVITGYLQGITCRTKHVNENVSIPYILLLVGGQEFDLAKINGSLVIRNTETGAIRTITHEACEYRVDGNAIKAEDLIDFFYAEIL